jgi:O-antigen ligase
MNFHENKLSNIDTENERLKSIIYNILLISAWIQNGLLYFGKIAISLITGSSILAEIIFIFYYCLLVVISFKYLIRLIRVQDIFLVLALIFIVIISYWFNEGNRNNIVAQLYNLFIKVIPFYFLGISLKATKKNMDMLYYASIFPILINWLYVVVIFATGRSFQEDNLAISYSVLPYVIMVLWYTMDKTTVFRIIVSILGILFIFSMGSRGPVVSICVFILFYVFYKTKSSIKKQGFIFILLIVLIAIIYSGLWKNIIIFLRDIVNTFGISTRVFDSVLINSAQGSNDARMRIYEVMWSYIIKRPLIGYGIYGEWAMINYTAHNLVLEMWVHFGMVIGTILIAIGVYMIGFTYFKSKSHFVKGFIIVLISFGLVRCIYAGSYLSYYIFLMMGFVVNQFRNIKRKIHVRYRYDNL